MCVPDFLRGSYWEGGLFGSLGNEWTDREQMCKLVYIVNKKSICLKFLIRPTLGSQFNCLFARSTRAVIIDYKFQHFPESWQVGSMHLSTAFNAFLSDSCLAMCALAACAREGPTAAHVPLNRLYGFFHVARPWNCVNLLFIDYRLSLILILQREVWSLHLGRYQPLCSNAPSGCQWLEWFNLSAFQTAFSLTIAFLLDLTPFLADLSFVQVVHFSSLVTLILCFAPPPLSDQQCAPLATRCEKKRAILLWSTIFYIP